MNKRARKNVPVVRERLTPLSLNSILPEDALSALMKADPDKVDERLKKSGVKKDKK